MKFKLFSVVVGTPACVASCPFCVSGEVPSKQNMCCPDVNWRNFKIAGELANRSGIDTVMLTSRGEPTLFPDQITAYLQHLEPFRFPFVELQSNCILFAQKKEYYADYLKRWYDLGLTTITISVVSHKPEVNKQIYLPNAQSYIDLPDLIKFLHGFGFSLRLTCVCCNGYTSTIDEIKQFVEFAKQNNVEQVTLRPVNDEFRRQSAQQWIEKHKLTDQQKLEIKAFFDKNATKLLDIERIGSVYDYNGQNVCFSLPLNKNTRDYNPDNGRQLIFFPDGHLRYEWEMPGGILL